jgi:hypothetical protein
MRQEATRSPTPTDSPRQRYRAIARPVCALAALTLAALLAVANRAESRPLYHMLVVKMPVPVKRVAALTCPGIPPDKLVNWPQRPGTPDPSGEPPQVPTVLVVDEQNHHSRVRIVDHVPVAEPLGDCHVPETGERPNQIDGSRVGVGTGYIAEAWLAVPTLKYRSGALGDVVTAEELRAFNRRGDTLVYRLPDDAVFEDRDPRMVTVDGQDAVLVVRSGLRSGSALALFGLDRRATDAAGLVLLAQSESLGAANRWLNPAGVGDFDGGGHSQIAAVLTPDRGGVLAVFERQGGKLVRRYRAAGFSNHENYSGELGMAALLDANGDGITDLAVPDETRHVLRIVTFAEGRFAELQRFVHESPIVSAIAAQTLTPGVTSLVYALENGTVVVLTK